MKRSEPVQQLDADASGILHNARGRKLDPLMDGAKK
jgi:hypothetical protein